MEQLLAYLLTTTDSVAYARFSTSFYDKFQKNIKDNNFKEVAEFIKQYKNKFDIVPTVKAAIKYYTLDNKQEVVEYLNKITQEYIKISREEFYIQLDNVASELLSSQYSKILLSAVSENNSSNKTSESIKKQVSELITKLDKVNTTLSNTKEELAGVVLGKDAKKDLAEIYKNILDTKDKEGASSFDIGLGAEFSQSKLKRGDLLIVPAFSSHGKSMFTRFLAHHLLTKYALNVVYISLEMSYKAVRPMFTVLHAASPRFNTNIQLDYNRFKEGQLSEAELDLILEAEDDLANNPNYGVLYITQPDTLNYTMTSVKATIDHVTRDLGIPVDVVVVDYLTLLKTKSGKADNWAEYNQLALDFKQLALGYTDAEGKPAPFIGIIPVQVNRQFNARLDKALALKLQGDEAIKTKKGETIAFEFTPSCIQAFTGLYENADACLCLYCGSTYKQNNKVMFQSIKWRDAELVPPSDYYINFKTGTYYKIKETTSQSIVSQIEELEL